MFFGSNCLAKYCKNYDWIFNFNKNNVKSRYCQGQQFYNHKELTSKYVESMVAYVFKDCEQTNCT